MLHVPKIFTLFFEHATDLMLFAGSDGRLVMANRALRDATGYSVQDIKELELSQLIVSPDVGQLLKLADEGPAEESYFQLALSSGDSIKIKGKLFLDEETQNYCGLFRAPSRGPMEAAAQESTSWMPGMLAAIPSAMMIFDIRGRCRQVLSSGDSCVKVDLNGKSLHDVLSESEVSSAMAMIGQAVQSQQSVQREYSWRIDDVDHWYVGHVVPFKADSDIAVLWIATDISDLVAAQQQVDAGHALMRQLIELAEQERRKVACEIHDGFVQHAVGAQTWLQSAKEELAGLQATRESLDTVEQCIAGARKMINQLRPIVSDKIDLGNGIANLCMSSASKPRLSLSSVCGASWKMWTRYWLVLR